MGVTRLTLDIDFLVPANQMAQAIESASSVAFDDVAEWIALPNNANGIDRLFRVNKIQDGEVLSLDLLEIHHSDNPIFMDRETFDVDGHKVKVLSRAGLITMKQSSGRLKDQLDVEMLNDPSEDR